MRGGNNDFQFGELEKVSEPFVSVRVSQGKIMLWDRETECEHWSGHVTDSCHHAKQWVSWQVWIPTSLFPSASSQRQSRGLARAGWSLARDESSIHLVNDLQCYFSKVSVALPDRHTAVGDPFPDLLPYLCHCDAAVSCLVCVLMGAYGGLFGLYCEFIRHLRPWSLTILSKYHQIFPVLGIKLLKNWSRC